MAKVLLHYKCLSYITTIESRSTYTCSCFHGLYSIWQWHKTVGGPVWYQGPSVQLLWRASPMVLNMWPCTRNLGWGWSVNSSIVLSLLHYTSWSTKDIPNVRNCHVETLTSPFLSFGILSCWNANFSIPVSWNLSRWNANFSIPVCWNFLWNLSCWNLKP